MPFTVIRWTYTPVDLFPIDCQEDGQDYSLTLRVGAAFAQLRIDSDPADTLLWQIEEKVRGLCLTQAAVRRKRFELNRAVIVRPDGSELPATASRIGIPVALRFGMPVLGDPRRSLEERASQRRTSYARHLNDPTVREILRFLRDAEDPRWALNRLYAVYEAIEARLKQAGRAGVEAKMAKLSAWRRLQDFTNGIPIDEGRHPGLHSDRLPVNDRALDGVHAIALEVVDAFIGHLDADDIGPAVPKRRKSVPAIG